ncbi:MAG: hypothetical protein H6765_07720 [Candidatus Peribacteria bacterium]|nr:MAG: hypothetical protein H6765_07720 [Candidatus Peribacteria bacterium]
MREDERWLRTELAEMQFEKYDDLLGDFPEDLDLWYFVERRRADLFR